MRAVPLPLPTSFLVAALTFGAGSGPASAQSATEIVSEALERYEDRLAGIEDLRIRHEVMGVTITAYMVRDTVDGHVILRPADEALAGAGLGGVGPAGELWATPHRLYAELADRWTLEGRRTVNGQETWRLVLEELDDIEWGTLPGHDTPFAPTRIELDLSVDELLPLMLTMEGEAEVGNDPRPFSFRVRLSDYREVNGYLHPYVTEIETEGAATELSEEELEEARASLRELQRELGAMPEEQRAMVERMMSGQIEMLEEMIAEDRIRLELRVVELEANTGPPDPR